jgi:hypothetical protein
MKQDRTHYSVRLTKRNYHMLQVALKKFGDSANSTLNLALRVGLQTIMLGPGSALAREEARRARASIYLNGQARRHSEGSRRR